MRNESTQNRQFLHRTATQYGSQVFTENPKQQSKFVFRYQILHSAKKDEERR